MSMTWPGVRLKVLRPLTREGWRAMKGVEYAAFVGQLLPQAEGGIGGVGPGAAIAGEGVGASGDGGDGFGFAAMFSSAQPPLSARNRTSVLSSWPEERSWSRTLPMPLSMRSTWAA